MLEKSGNVKMPNNNFLRICFFATLSLTFAFADDEPKENLEIKFPTPDISASIGIGFNYDYLKSPLGVDFENAKGYYSVNIPIKFQPGYELNNTIFGNIAKDNFSETGEDFMPNMAARQFANTTIKVDVPMLFGVCSFSHINVMSLKYENSTGIPSFRERSKLTNDKKEDIGELLLLGNLNVPIDFSLGWEAMTFGYVYRINKLVAVGLNLHRHRFHFNATAHVDMDLYGKVNVEAGGVELPSVSLDYSLKNSLSAEYTLERWSPTFAVSVWNFDFVARIMFKDEAKGALSGKYVLPFFMNASTFEIDERFSEGDLDFISDNIDKLMGNDTQTVTLSTNKNMKWELPHVLTFKYNIIPEHLSVSYSKFIGRTYFGLVDPDVGKYGNDAETQTVDFLKDGLDLRASLKLDHLILIYGKLGWFYGNLGIVSLDVDFNNSKNVLGSQDQDFLIQYGKGVMLPVLSGGGIIGTKIQIMLELDLLPLPALKTGLVYNF